MQTITMDPLALMPRGDAVAVATPVVSGEGADFAQALADMLAGDGAVTTGAPVDAAVPAETGSPLPVLDAVGKIAVPVATANAPTVPVVPAIGEGMLGEAEATAALAAPGAAVAAVASVDAAAPGAEVGEVQSPTDRSAEVVTMTAPDVPAKGKAAREGRDDAEAPPSPEGDEEVAEVAPPVVAGVMQDVKAPVIAAALAVDPLPKPGATELSGAEDAVAAAVAPAPRAPKAARPADAGKAQDAEVSDKDAGDATVDRAAESQRKDRLTDPRAMPQRNVETVPVQAEKRQSDGVVAVADVARGADPGAMPSPVPSTTAAQPQTQAGAAVPIATDRPGWEAAVTERIAAELSEDGQQIELELSPEHLGGLKIKLEVADGQAQVRFVTETPEAARLIQQNEHRLSESLSRAGLSLGGHDSASRDAQAQGDRSGRPSPRGAEIAFQRPAEPRADMGSGRGASGLVNLMA